MGTLGHMEAGADREGPADYECPRSTAVTITTSPRQRMTQMQGDKSGHRATGGREAVRKKAKESRWRGTPQMLSTPQVEDITVPDKNIVCGQAQGKLGVLEH